MPTPWESNLEKLRVSLKAIHDSNQKDFTYGVVQVHGELNLKFRRPRIYASGGPLLSSLMIPLNEKQCQFHYFFSESDVDGDRSVFEQFKLQLREVRTLLADLPQRVSTYPKIPPLTNGIDESLAIWGLLLLWIGGTDQEIFHTEVEYETSSSDFATFGDTSSWSLASCDPKFSPLQLITRTSELDKDWEFWAGQHRHQNRSFPEVFAASLTKPIIYASINAIDIVIHRGREQHPKSRTKRSTKQAILNRTQMTENELLVHSALKKHHSGKDGVPNFEKIEQIPLGEMIGISQPSVSRALEGLLKNVSFGKGLDPSRRYELLCENRLILEILEHIENPKKRDELTSSELDLLDSDGR